MKVKGVKQAIKCHVDPNYIFIFSHYAIIPMY